MNLPFLRPLACPPGVEPHLWREALASAIEELQDTMQAMIAAIDAMDTDPDLEDAGDELDQSYPEGWRTLMFERQGWHEDAEVDDPDEDSDAGEANGDQEPACDGRAIVTLNPVPVPTRRIRRRLTQQ